ncbi:nuclear transport factor 2 family protein [Natronorubrum thiooxidans]|uniref:SnoaL-like domain-containing protein n=1 Tax=Natronorubrum thiooxidans TaxID=308853 RepID=A0A1N7FAV5_9EURY|nr:nuclear transport factor 2 family protein [Natronorubrum thiooxidans]SIR97450.1 SnoaL-like domain-containing protein [Natronorubrum thiooxidans]
MSDRAETAVRDYYDALRSGEPLSPYFLEEESTVKFGISESLYGFEAVSEALREQTETTAEWAVESHHLVVTERDGVATFVDEVTMAWTDTEDDERRRFETRWSGALVETAERETAVDTREWLFATMHVSVAHEL